MKDFIINMIGRERVKKLYFKVQVMLNAKMRKSFNKVKKCFCEVSETKNNELYNCLAEFYFSAAYLNTDIGKKDMEDHLVNRLFNFRYRTIPWINSFASIKKSKVLEIGCGTGCTTVALAEQGCELTSIDIDENSINVAKKRCEIYGLSAEILVMSSIDINELNKKFDIIIFSASLEHMTYEERIKSLKLAWEMLKQDGFLVVIETPNRLYYYDNHSSMLHFYHWLPDQIAIQYSKFSPREACINNSHDEMKFIRFGRGASFHEFEIALGIRYNQLKLYNMQSFEKTVISSIASDEYKYSKMLRKFGPKDMQDGFYYKDLYIAIKKL
jgi:S-adenosylmethionine-dependent methyltransferase